MQDVHCPLPPGSEAVYSRSSTAHCPQAVRQCIAEVAPPTAPRQWGSALRKAHCPLPPGTGAVYCRSSSAHCPRAVSQCIAGDPPPPAPRQWSSALQKSHCPLPPGSEAVRCRTSTAHSPGAVAQCVAGVPLPTAPGRRQCIAGDAQPTAPREGDSERREYHSPLPSGNAAVRSTISTAHSPQPAWHCVTLPTAPCPQQQCTRAHTVQCGAEHQAVRHHTEGTGGAARHAGCSGQMRPCVTARRRQQGSVGQVRECTGPAMPQHTYTQGAHNTHSPARLPVPVGRHPGLCLLVTAPEGNRQRPRARHSKQRQQTSKRQQHSTQQHNTGRSNAAHHSIQGHSTPQHTATQNKTRQQTTTRTRQQDDTTRDATRQAAGTQSATQRAPQSAEQPTTKQSGTPHHDKQH